MSETYLETAHRARALRIKGESNPEIKVALGYRSSAAVGIAVTCASLDASFEEPRLSPDELELLVIIGQTERLAVANGDGRAPKLKYCKRWNWPPSRPAYLAYKRLGTHRRGEDPRKPGTGLGLINPYNGYVRLTRAGWAFVHAIEAAKGGVV